MGHGQSGKGNRRMPSGPPPRSRQPDADAGPTITEKIAARKKEGGAQSWDDFKAKMKEKQREQFAADNHEVLMSAAHREVLDREREARLNRTHQAEPAAKRHKSDKKSDKEKKSKKDKHKKEKKHKVRGRPHEPSDPESVLSGPARRRRKRRRRRRAAASGSDETTARARRRTTSPRGARRASRCDSATSLRRTTATRYDEHTS